MEVEYIEILNRYLIHCWLFCFIPVVIVLVIFLIEITKKKFDKTTLSLLLIPIIFLSIGIWHTVEVRLDITQNSTQVVSFDNSKYYADTTDSSGDFLTFAQTVTIKTDDNIILDLICRDDIFPYNAEKGTIVYATHTKMILDYIPKE